MQQTNCQICGSCVHELSYVEDIGLWICPSCWYELDEEEYIIGEYE